jgi:hypothetical protein
MRHSRTAGELYDGGMPSSELAILPVERLSTAEEVPEAVYRELGDTQRHLLHQAQAVERVVQMVAIPRPLVGTMHRLTVLLDGASWARHVADEMRQPLELGWRSGRKVNAGASLGAAENVAQHSMQQYRAALLAEWPVTAWGDALQAIVRCGASEGAWSLVSLVAEGLYGAPGSVEWWHAVLTVDGMWGERHYAAEEPIVG